jgi:hypothetical protein
VKEEEMVGKRHQQGGEGDLAHEAEAADSAERRRGGHGEFHLSPLG